MKKFKITLMVPQTKEIVVADAQTAHNEASRLVEALVQNGPKASLHSIEFISDVETEPLDL